VVGGQVSGEVVAAEGDRDGGGERRPPARLPVTWPAGLIVTARTVPAPTSATNWV
jgi:hypothetical protein